MSQELITIPSENALQVFTGQSSIDPYLAKIRAEIDSFTPDVSTRKGREEIASVAYKVAKSKTYLESVGKQLADAQKEIPKKIDATRKHIRDTLDAWKDEVRQPLTEWEQAEEDRVNSIKNVIAGFDALAADMDERESSQIRETLSAIKKEVISEERFQEYTAAGAAAKDKAISALESALIAVEKREAEAAELTRLRQESEERARKDREAQIAREAQERAEAEAEQKARAAAEAAEKLSKAAAEAAERRELELRLSAERAEREKVEAQRRAENAEKEAKEKAEREHAAKLKAEKEEAERREANKAHKAKINNGALKAFVAGGMTEDAAKLAVSLIAKRAIPAISIQY